MTLDGIVQTVAWVATAFSPVLLVGLVVSWVVPHCRRTAGPATGPPTEPAGTDPASGSTDQLPSDSLSTIRSTDRR